MWKFSNVNLAAVARELGAFSVRIEDPADLPGALREAQRSGRPAVIDVVTEAAVLPATPYGGRDFYAVADDS
jgi:acetolactate synthase-1/2/3 large subunit